MADKVKGAVLYVGQAYYNTWYLSRELRKIGWTADLLNFDRNKENDLYYHGEDVKFLYNGPKDMYEHVKFYIDALVNYDIYHFSNAHGLYFLDDFDLKGTGRVSPLLQRILKAFTLCLLGSVCNWKPYRVFRVASLIGAKNLARILYLCRNYLPERWDVKLLKRLGKKIIYSNNGCLDGVSQSSFSLWPPEPVCDICVWKHVPQVCSDERNLAWGKLRNSLADYQVTLGGNRKDYNDDPRVHEVPQFYCLDPNFWKPDPLIPSNYLLPFGTEVVKIYHSVGNFDSRTDAQSQKNIKCTHIYVPLVETLKKEGVKVELIFFKDVPNKTLLYYLAQADIVVDMLTLGWFGANVREAMMMGKPSICFLRQEWLDSMHKEIPEYIDELPVISATPETVYEVLKHLIGNAEERQEIGRRSREFAVKWHSGEAGAKRFDQIYSALLSNRVV